jgi:hypothetical protein
MSGSSGTPLESWTPPPAPGSGRYVAPAVIVGIAVVAVVLGLALSGVLPFFGAHGSPTPATLSYGQASQVAESTAYGYGGGSWTPVAAAGSAVGTPSEIPGTSFAELSANISKVAGCVVTWYGSVIRDGLPVPATPVSAGTGDANFWIFTLTSPNGTILVVSIADGQGTILAAITGFVCAIASGDLHGIPAASVSSATAVAIANDHGGSAFLTTYPKATRSWSLVGTVTYNGTTRGNYWGVVYSTCPMVAPFPTSPQPVFDAALNATTGAVIVAHAGNTTCTAGFNITLPTSVARLSNDPVAAGAPSDALSVTEIARLPSRQAI